MNEFLLFTEAGFDPVGLVVGSSIFHIGIQIAGPTTSRELDTLSQAMYSARHLAMTRMEEEADQLGADGIVGVRLDIGRYEWGPNMAEFIAIGTAVKHRDGVLHRAPNGRPFQSDLSGQEFWTLLRTGHRPVGMVMGSCVFHVGRRGPLRTIAQTGRNIELPNYTQALYEARELAMQRMQTEAQELGAEGIVGVSLSERSHGWGSHVIEFFALGTAIVSTGEGTKIEPPVTVLDLNDPAAVAPSVGAQDLGGRAASLRCGPGSRSATRPRSACRGSRRAASRTAGSPPGGRRRRPGRAPRPAGMPRQAASRPGISCAAVRPALICRGVAPSARLRAVGRCASITVAQVVKIALIAASTARIALSRKTRWLTRSAMPPEPTRYPAFWWLRTSMRCWSVSAATIIATAMVRLAAVSTARRGRRAMSRSANSSGTGSREESAISHARRRGGWAGSLSALIVLARAPRTAGTIVAAAATATATATTSSDGRGR